MLNNNLKIKEKVLATGELSEAKWLELVEIVKNQFNYSEAKAESISNSKLLKLIAAIPFVANCENPGRTALVHLITTLIAAEYGKELFLHKFNDNVSLKKRLHEISNFDGGNQEIINKGMNLLSLVMISDHNNDAESDEAKGKYNPINSSIWNFDQLKDQLVTECNSIQHSQLDDIMSVKEAFNSLWGV